jgi:xylulokinase
VVPLDARDRPLRPAILYSDRRAQAEADEINAVRDSIDVRTDNRFNASFALPRILWMVRHEPQIWEKTARIAHAADTIVGKLTGECGVSDQSNALKTGFDLVAWRWPDFIETRLGIDARRLPRIVMSGEAIGRITQGCADETGLSERTSVAAGMTDSSADQVASGARDPGDWNTVLGTTLVLKGLTRQLVRDPEGRVYCHRHPMGTWMPSGASNVGARILDERFGGADREALGEAALGLFPTDLTLYPLPGRGERFPINRPDMVGFLEGAARSQEELYAAHLEAIGFVERLAYDVMRDLGAEITGRVWTTGGGARSAAWRQIRADILDREIACAAHPSAAAGSAIVAASRSYFPDIAAAGEAMVRLDSVVTPRAESVDRAGAAYARFLAALRARGFPGAPAGRS